MRVRVVLSRFQFSAGIVALGTTTVRATVLDNRFMPILAYNGFGAGEAGAAAQVGLACRLS